MSVADVIYIQRDGVVIAQGVSRGTTSPDPAVIARAIAWATDSGACWPRCTLRRSAARRICAAILSMARSSAALRS